MTRSDSRRNTPATTLHLGAIALGCLLWSACSSGSNSGSPRVSSIPAQFTAGKGTMFTFDLGPFVTDPEGDALTFTVVSGGGVFTGSSYSGMFATLGEFDVVFRVADAFGSSDASFQVVVTQAEFAVVQRDGAGLVLLDTDTQALVTVSSASTNETFETGLSSGELVYERTLGGNTDLFVFDTFARTARTIGDDIALDETFVATTADESILFSTHDGANTNLFLWNPITKFARTVSATQGEDDGNAVVSSSGLIFFERTSGGQPDVLFFDPSDDTTTVVADAPTAERIVAVLPNGAVVFSRVSGTGETDLLYFAIGTGTVEVGGDLGAAVGLLSKTFVAQTSQNQVVFSTPGATAGNSNVQFWTPSLGASTNIGTDISFTFRGVSSDDVVVWSQIASAQDDLFGFAISSSTSPFTISANVANESFATFVQQGGTTYVVYARDGAPASVQVYNVTATTTAAITNPAGVEFEAALPSGDVVVSLADDSSVRTYQPSADTTEDTTASLTATSFAFAGAASDAGDIVISALVSGQNDLYLWDASATAAVAVSADAGTDVFQAITTNGDIVFTRVTTTGNGNADLFLYTTVDDTIHVLTTGTSTDDTFDHTVLGSFSVDRS